MNLTDNVVEVSEQQANVRSTTRQKEEMTFPKSLYRYAGKYLAKNLVFC